MEIQLVGLNVYHAKGAENATSSILYIHDAFGWKLINNRLLCDKFAKETGFDVYMPDFYDGLQVVTEE